eukprot:jgi/Astpho2/621/Aster-04463
MVSLALGDLQAAYNAGRTSPSEVVKGVASQLKGDVAFLSLTPMETLMERCRALEQQPASHRGALWGVPFAVKDNIDVEGHATTAACKAFTYQPQCSAAVVQALIDAGGVMVGKTNMDQFAAGLVGTRTPFGTARNAFDDRFIPGGSSAGSGSAVGRTLVSFALGTDTAGSGRIPAGLNGCVGIKPSVGRLSNQGLVPAAASLDCITCFARSVRDAATVVRIMQEASNRLADPTCRTPDNARYSRRWEGEPFTFGIPSPQFLDFSGPGGVLTKDLYERLFGEAVAQLNSLGGTQVDIDFTPFAETAALLYESSFVAERYAGIRAFLERASGTANGLRDDHPKTRKKRHLHPGDILQDPRLERVLGAILSGAPNFVAADVFEDLAKLRVLQAAARVQMAKVDCLLVPTALHHYTVKEIELEERPAEQDDKPAQVTWKKNAKLGRFTNFVNLLDMCGVAVPSAIYTHPKLDPETLHGEAKQRGVYLAASGDPTPKLPFGVTFIANSWLDEWLWGLAERYHDVSGLGCGPHEHLKVDQSASNSL